jgi:type IV pilus assembly protein PilF
VTTRFSASVATALAAVVVMLGCAAPVSEPTGRDRVTASDQTDADRRARLRLELASAYYGRGQYETALDEVKQALAAKPDLWEGWNLRGLIYASLGDEPLAEESFKRALQLNSRDGDTMHNYAWFLCQRRRYPESIALFQKAISQPQYASTSRSLMAMGVCQAGAGSLADAERSLARAYELDPSNPITGVNLSEVLYQRGEYERARFYIRRVNAMTDVTNAQTLWLAARIENKLGNARGARELGQQLRNRFPQSPEAALYERGKFDE